MGIALVIEYDSALLNGREVVAAFETEEAAKRFAESIAPRTVRVVSPKRKIFQYSVKHIHQLRDRGADLHSVEKVDDGLLCCGEHWPYDKEGSGPEGRAMPGDIWLWARTCEHRASMARRHG